jgi:predicted DNA-binding transcriptional regulator YafY
MNRIDRISAILIQLQSKKVVKGQEIADRFKISLRTAYRDIKSLEEAGVPIISDAGVGYSLVEGYRIPPVMFTREEASTFLAAEKLVQKFTDADTFRHYQEALYKIKAVLRGEEKDHLNSLYEHVEILESSFLPKSQTAGNHLPLLLQNISTKSVLEMEYFANHNQETTQRKIEPVGIFLDGSVWYLLAYCHLRTDYRTFRIDRIKKLKTGVLKHKKEHPPLKTFLKSYVRDKKDLKEVVVRISKEAMKYIGDQKYYCGFVSEEIHEKFVEMHFLTASLNSFARWYVMYGDLAEVVRPAALKDEITRLTKSIQKRL